MKLKAIYLKVTFKSCVIKYFFLVGKYIDATFIVRYLVLFSET